MNNIYKFYIVYGEKRTLFHSIKHYNIIDIVNGIIEVISIKIFNSR